MVSRHAALVCGLLQSELHVWRPTIQSVSLRSLSHDRVLVVCVATDPGRAEQLAESAYAALAPLDRGEAITDPSTQQAFTSGASGMPVPEPIEAWSETLDDDVQAALHSEGLLSGEQRQLMVACVVSDASPVNFEELRAQAYAKSWLGEPRAPGQLCNARYRVSVGAGRYELVPRQFQQLCSLQKSGMLFSVAKSADEFDHIPLHLLDADGCDERATMQVKDLARSVGVPAEVLYGYEAKSRLRVVAYRSRIARDWVATRQSLRKELLQVTANNSAIKSELAAEFDRCREKVVGRLEKRLDKASQRRTLRPRPGFLAGRAPLLEPTNEMETVWLTSRLEPDISSVWPGFKLLDYTPKDGIDAIVRCRLGPLGVEQLHALEFEFDLRNFFGMHTRCTRSAR